MDRREYVSSLVYCQLWFHSVEAYCMSPESSTWLLAPFTWGEEGGVFLLWHFQEILVVTKTHSSIKKRENKCQSTSGRNPAVTSIIRAGSFSFELNQLHGWTVSPRWFDALFDTAWSVAMYRITNCRLVARDACAYFMSLQAHMGVGRSELSTVRIPHGTGVSTRAFWYIIIILLASAISGTKSTKREPLFSLHYNQKQRVDAWSTSVTPAHRIIEWDRVLIQMSRADLLWVRNAWTVPPKAQNRDHGTTARK